MVSLLRYVDIINVLQADRADKTSSGMCAVKLDRFHIKAYFTFDATLLVLLLFLSILWTIGAVICPEKVT